MENTVRRFRVEIGAEESARLKLLQEQVAAELPDLIKRDQMRKDASKEATLSGGLRRAIHSLQRIAAMIGAPLLLLDEFVTGERTLRSDVIDRLAIALGYSLKRNL